MVVMESQTLTSNTSLPGFKPGSTIWNSPVSIPPPHPPPPQSTRYWEGGARWGSRAQRWGVRHETSLVPESQPWSVCFASTPGVALRPREGPSQARFGCHADMWHMTWHVTASLHSEPSGQEDLVPTPDSPAQGRACDEVQKTEESYLPWQLWKGFTCSQCSCDQE